MDFNAWSSELVLMVQSARRMADRLNVNLVIDEQKALEFTRSTPPKINPIIDLDQHRSLESV